MKQLIPCFLVLYATSSLLKHQSTHFSNKSTSNNLIDVDDTLESKAMTSTTKANDTPSDQNRKAKKTGKKITDFTKELDDIRSDLKKEKDQLKLIEAKKKHKKNKKARKRKHRALRSKHKKHMRKAHKKRQSKKSEAKKRKLLLRKFYHLDNKAQIRKLMSIYKSYGININKLGSKDLKYIINNSKDLLKKYHNTDANSPQDRDLQVVSESAANSQQAQMTQSAQEANYQPDLQTENYQQSMQRQLILPPPAEKGAQEQFKANEVSGGSMAVKFPDSPPTTYVTQQPFYSY